MILSGQRDVEAPWHLLKKWVEHGSKEPDPALIFALTEPSLPRAFYYCVDTDHFTDTDTGPFNIRVGICINSLILIALIPSDDSPREPGAPVLSNSGVKYKLLWPQDREIIPIPPTPAKSELIGYGDWIKFMVDQVNAGIRRRG
jgi:hypothetical protein